MNFFGWAIARAASVALIMMVSLVMYTIVHVRVERHLASSYRALGQKIADPGSAQLNWTWWPPKIKLEGRYHGVPFLYGVVGHSATHLTYTCSPSQAFMISFSPRSGNAPGGTLVQQLNTAFPAWTGFMTTPHRVSWLHRSLDRRPIGFGRGPGVDVYRGITRPFDPEEVQSDLDHMEPFCR